MKPSFTSTLGGFQRLDRVGQEVVRVGVNLEFHPLRQSGGGGEAGETDRLLGGVGPARIGQEQVTLRVDEFQDIGEGVVFARQIGAPEGDRHDLTSAGVEGVAHELVGGKLPVPMSET